MASSSYYNNNNNLKELERITSSVNDALLPSFLEEEENNNNHVVCGVMSIITFIWLVIFCVTGVGLGLCYEFLEIHSLHHAPGAASDTFFFMSYRILVSSTCWFFICIYTKKSNARCVD